MHGKMTNIKVWEEEIITEGREINFQLVKEWHQRIKGEKYRRYDGKTQDRITKDLILQSEAKAIY